MSVFPGPFDPPEASSGPLVANPAIQSPLSLQVLFPQTCPTEPDRLAQVLRSYHPTMAEVRCEVDPERSREGALEALVGWGRHVVRCIGSDLPLRAQVVESCVASAQYAAELKERARTHGAHLRLLYVGHDAEPLEQYVALAAMGGALAWLGAIVVLNEAGRTSFPASVLSGAKVEGDILYLLRTLPLPVLYCGFAMVEAGGGRWMRTYGAQLIGFPNLAARAGATHEGPRYFAIFDSLLGYLRDSGARLAPGHTMQVGEGDFLCVRRPRVDEQFLKGEGEGELWVLELIGAHEIGG